MDEFDAPEDFSYESSEDSYGSDFEIPDDIEAQNKSYPIAKTPNTRHSKKSPPPSHYVSTSTVVDTAQNHTHTPNRKDLLRSRKPANKTKSHATSVSKPRSSSSSSNSSSCEESSQPQESVYSSEHSRLPEPKLFIPEVEVYTSVDKISVEFSILRSSMCWRVANLSKMVQMASNPRIVFLLTETTRDSKSGSTSTQQEMVFEILPGDDGVYFGKRRPIQPHHMPCRNLTMAVIPKQQHNTLYNCCKEMHANSQQRRDYYCSARSVIRCIPCIGTTIDAFYKRNHPNSWCQAELISHILSTAMPGSLDSPFVDNQRLFAYFKETYSKQTV
jgi:hypothetical protein